MKDNYYAEYGTVETCQKTWVSSPQNNIMFPPQVNYLCDKCKKSHNFRLRRTYTSSTPKQNKAFEEYCSRNNLESGVNINI